MAIDCRGSAPGASRADGTGVMRHYRPQFAEFPVAIAVLTLSITA